MSHSLRAALLAATLLLGCAREPAAAPASYTIEGEVERAGQQPLSSDTTILDAITEARPRATSDLQAVTLLRPDPSEPLVVTVDVQRMLTTGDSSANVLLSPGDEVFVPARD